MSTAQNDKLFIDGENYGQRNLQHKQFNSERKHNIRKQALSEIKNVIHNQASITPFKGLQAGPSKSLCTDLLKKQAEHLKSQVDHHPKFEQLQKIQAFTTNKVVELDKRDLPAPRTCNEKCCKSLEEIWSDFNVLEPEILERIVNGDCDTDNDYDIPNRNLTPIDFEDDFDLTFELQDPYELENKKHLDNLLAKDYECAEFPVALNWIDDL